MKTAKNILIKLSLLFIVLGIIFFCFLLDCNRNYIGGDATSGYKTTAAYFVKNLDTNEFKAVSAKAWYFNYILTISTFLFFGLGMLGYAYLLIKFTFSSIKRRLKKYFE